jgi:hypothetical protein
MVFLDPAPFSGLTWRLGPASPCVTGRRSNRLNHAPTLPIPWRYRAFVWGKDSQTKSQFEGYRLRRHRHLNFVTISRSAARLFILYYLLQSGGDGDFSGGTYSIRFCTASMNWPQIHMRNYSKSGRRRLNGIVLRVSLLASIAAALCWCCVGESINRPIKSLYHTRWTVREGVPKDVIAIQQTPDGYLWLGTGEGLFRFDGVRFERYEPNRGGELFSGRISALLATKDGGLWIAHQGRGVRASFLKNGEVRSYASSDPQHLGTILAFAQSPDGTMWAATDYGLECLEGAHWIDVGPHYDRASSYPETVFVDHRGILWVNTRAGLQYRPLGQSQVQTADATISENVDITEAPDGSVWMASVRGWVRKVTRPDGSLLREYPHIVAKSLGIAFTHDGALWIATVGDGLLRAPFPNRLPANRKMSLAHNMSGVFSK